MKQVLRQAAGIDVAQKELVVCLGRMTAELTCELFARQSFPNSPKGFAALVQWTEKRSDPSASVRYVMEATGVYHEQLAYYLTDRGHAVSVVLPSKIAHYVKTLEVKTITDKTASEAICRFAVERSLEGWQQPHPVYRRLRALTRERDGLVQQRTAVKNQLHAEVAEAYGGPSTIKRLKKRIQLLDQQEREIACEIEALLQSEEKIYELSTLLQSIPGVGMLTTATVLGETGGFELIRNGRQLASYAGLDVKEKQSGTSVKATPRISKKGNKYLRKSLHFPALTATRHDEHFKGLFARLVSRHGIKMKAAVAVQRKLLQLMFTIYKTGVPYDKNFHKDKAAAEGTQLAVA
jgi:transposase